MQSAFRFLFLALAIGLLSACSGDEESPEEQIRRFIDAGVQAAESRSVDGLSELLHRDFIDEKGNNRSQVAKLLRVYFIRHKNIHLFTRIDNIEMLTDNQASVSLYVAMAGTVIADVDALASLRARVYRFEFQLLKQDEWRLRHAKWEPANIGAFE